MKPPTEADLIELENRILVKYIALRDENDGFTHWDRTVATLEYLIDRARFHNAERASTALSDQYGPEGARSANS
jgi:hypothetical protein